MIKIFENNYDKSEFYSLMGQYFAEDKYNKELPYIKNNDKMMWFVMIENNQVVAFSAIEKFKNKIVLATTYTEEQFRRKGYFKKLTDIRIEYGENLNLPMEIATNNQYIKKYMEDKGFEIYRTTTNYVFLRRDVNNE